MNRTNFPGSKVMVIDDEPGVCDILSKVLSKEGYQVRTALSGPEALDIMKSDPAHVTLLDIKMPGMDGIEVLRNIRCVAPEAIVIILTAYGTLETAREALKLGAYDYITKPFDNEFVKAMVREALLEGTKSNSG